MKHRAPRRKPSPRKTRRQPNASTPEKMHRRRIRFIMFGFLLVYGAIAARLFMLNFDPDMRFAEEDLLHVGEAQIDRPRGDVTDRNGRVLATNRNVPSLSVNPSEVDNPEALAAWLAPRLGESPGWVRERLTRTDTRGNPMKFVWLKRRMTDEEFARLGDLSDAPESGALLLQDEPVRYYPEGDLAAHVLGFANREGQGAEGIELRYDEYLRSKAGKRKSRVLQRNGQRFMMGYKTIEYEPPTGGDDVRLTIDATLQFALEEELDAALERNNARRAMGLLMDPDSGAILAMATRPAFDPNHYMDYTAEQRRNRAIIDTFEPGSSFKIVTASAALEQGLITPNEEIDCMEGRFNPYGHTIRDTHPLGVATFTQCFAVSSNIAIIKVAALLGPERLEAWIRHFGFGQPTGLDLPGEETGIFRPRSRWSGLSMGSLPMGQEVSVTMVQLARAFSVIANGGLLVHPHVVQEIHSAEGGLTWQFEPGAPNRVISESTADTMRSLCYQVVTNEEGTGSRAAIPEYRVGGKTGTAQIAKPDGTGYYSDRYTAVFAGFAPVSDPRVTCVIVVQEPMILNHYGGYVCGPVFSRIVREALVRLNVPPDPMKLDSTPVDDDLSPDLRQRMELAMIEPPEEAEGRDGLELLRSKEDELNQGLGLPSFIGLTKREAKALAVSLGVPWDPQGVGRVVHQDPPPGTRLEDVRLCTLVFSGPLTNDVKL